MRLLTQEVPKDFNIFQISCTHFGSRLCHQTGINTLLEMVNSKYEGVKAKHNYVIHHGDIIEAICPDDKRFFSVTISQPMILSQVDYAIKRLSNISPANWIAIMQGNHEDHHLKFGYLGALIADGLGVPFATSECKITYKYKNWTLFKQYAAHGRKQITSVADDPERATVNMKLILKRQMKFKAGDCYLMTKGHTHKLITLKPRPVLYLQDDGRAIHQNYTKQTDISGEEYIHPDNRWYANVGAFYKIYGNQMTQWDSEHPEDSVFSSYVARGEYDPIPLGFCIVRVREGKIQQVDKITV